MTPTIRIEDPDQPDIVALLRAADAWYATLYPAESNHLLDIATLQRPEIAFFAARQDGILLGCGAVAERGDYAEIKRMYLNRAARGRGLGRRILQALEDHAVAKLGLRCFRLETGIHQPEAIGLYRAAGYRDIAPFGDYAPDPLSLFMEKTL
jgi:putative acetyltransferase